jgi:hypothetical protein
MRQIAGLRATKQAALIEQQARTGHCMTAGFDPQPATEERKWHLAEKHSPLSAVALANPSNSMT